VLMYPGRRLNIADWIPATCSLGDQSKIWDSRVPLLETSLLRVETVGIE
jgi:hypothetical protein